MRSSLWCGGMPSRTGPASAGPAPPLTVSPLTTGCDANPEADKSVHAAACWPAIFQLPASCRRPASSCFFHASLTATDGPPKGPSAAAAAVAAGVSAAAAAAAAAGVSAAAAAAAAAGVSARVSAAAAAAAGASAAAAAAAAAGASAAAAAGAASTPVTSAAAGAASTPATSAAAGGGGGGGGDRAGAALLSSPSASAFAWPLWLAVAAAFWSAREAAFWSELRGRPLPLCSVRLASVCPSVPSSGRLGCSQNALGTSARLRGHSCRPAGQSMQQTQTVIDMVALITCRPSRRQTFLKSVVPSRRSSAAWPTDMPNRSAISSLVGPARPHRF